MKRVEDLIVWEKAQDVYVELKSLFGNSKDYFFRGQILRAGLSISNNIVEGFERMTEKEFRYFPFVAQGLCGKVRPMLYLAFKKNDINKEQRNKLVTNSKEISNMLAGLIKKMNIFKWD